MTAFARASLSLDNVVLTWELRSLNSRYLESFFRIPDSFRQLEENLRPLIKTLISRGKVECFLRIDSNASSNKKLNIQEDVILSLQEQAQTIHEKHHIPFDLTMSDYLSYPSVLSLNDTLPEISSETILSLFKEALITLDKVRSEEGKAISDILNVKLNEFFEECSRAGLYSKAAILEKKSTWTQRLQEMMHNSEISSTRFEQELAFLITKLDVQEEIDRLNVHGNALKALFAEMVPIGRHGDFLIQELQREANTLCSKSEYVPLIQSGLALKVLIEQMREQIQNIE